jgi:DNA-binding NarL/FixJ family response regulator
MIKNMKSETIEVAIVEDSQGIREQWERLLNGAGLHCACTCANGEEALERLPVCAPQVVLMDISMPGISGIECTARLKRLLPETQILMVTVHNDHDRVFQALQAGASGYLLKRSTPTELREAIREVLRGGGPMSGEVARLVIETFHKAPAAIADTDQVQLTVREKEVLEQVSRGFANKEIADRLGISFDTVRTHLKHIYEKLHVRCRAEAVAKHMERRKGLACELAALL